MVQGMQMLVRGDIRRGAMLEQVPDNITRACTCDLQFKMKACRAWLLRDTHNVTSRLPCPAARVVYVGERSWVVYAGERAWVVYIGERDLNGLHR